MLSCNGVESGRRVDCVLELDGAEVGLARLRALADELTDEAAATIALIWRSQRAVLGTRQDSHLPYFQEACDRMAATGWPVVLRKSGGGACPVSPGTIQVATIEPAGPGATMNAKYEALTKLIQSTLQFYGVVSRTGTVAGAYCTGGYDLSVQDKKIAGLSQHWFRNRSGIRCVITTGSINVEETPVALAEVANAFYRSAGSTVQCQADALTSVRQHAASAVADIPDLVRAFMKQLASFAECRGDTSRQALQAVPQTAGAHQPVTE